MRQRGKRRCKGKKRQTGKRAERERGSREYQVTCLYAIYYAAFRKSIIREGRDMKEKMQRKKPEKETREVACCFMSFSCVFCYHI